MTIGPLLFYFFINSYMRERTSVRLWTTKAIRKQDRNAFQTTIDHMKEEVMIYQVREEDATKADFSTKLTYINKALETKIQELIRRANQFGSGFQMQKNHLMKFL
jgi:thiamine monophosphate synthase